MIQILRGDCRDVLKTLAADSLDACVTDPPYGLSEHSAEDVAACLRAWLAGEAYDHDKAGFMGKKWDSFVPGPDVWRELYRVLKPGAHALVFAGTRTAGMMEVSLRLAGFEIRDSIEAGGFVSAARLTWRFGSGFPKSLDVGKAIDKGLGVPREDKFGGALSRRVGPTGNKKCESCGKWLVSGSPCRCPRPQDAPITPEAARWAGWGTALKPAYEPIIVARKPLAGTVAANVMKHGTGAINVDGCRIATTDEVSTHSRGNGYDGPAFHRMNPMPTRVQPGQLLGRWPPNTLLVHLPECERSGTREVASDAHWPSDRGAGSQVAGPSGHEGQSGLAERSPKTEAVATYRCAPGCPVAAIDCQSGPSGAAAQASGATRKGASTSRARNRYGGAETEAPFYEDAGGASRFSPNFEYSALDVPFLYCAKAPRKEREAGLSAAVMLCSCEATRSAWVGEDQPANTPAGTDIPRERDTTESTTKGASAWRTMSSGSVTTEASPQGSTCTTSTKTSRTTESKTLRSSTASSTSDAIPAVNMLTACGGSPAEFAESESPSPTNTGTCLEPGSPATGGADLAISERSCSPSNLDARACRRCRRWIRPPTTSVDKSAADNGVWNVHCTVKPVALLRWLLRLVVPPGGTVIDPFAGSGSTLVAAVYEGVSGIGIELDQDAAGESAGYVAIAEARVAHAQRAAPTPSAPPAAPAATPPPETSPAQQSLFDLLAKIREAP